jgi:hypothetical protein
MHSAQKKDNVKMGFGEMGVGGCVLDSSGSRWGPVTGSCEHGIESFGSIKGGDFLD